MSQNDFDNSPEEMEEALENDPSGSEMTDDSESPEIDLLEKTQKELEEQKEKYIRLFAEFDNYKRRTSREFIDLRLTASKDLMISLLEILDDMDRAEEQINKTETNSALKEGTLLVFNKMRKVLESKGLKALDTLHTEFDVEKDEAVSEVPVTDKKLKGKVVAEVQKGYFLNDKLIRFAKVVVGT